MPDKFIPLLEHSGQIITVGAYVLNEACSQHQKWRQQGLPPLRISVNISPRQFSNADTIMTTVEEALKANQLDAQWLELEITESTLLKDMDTAIDTMQKLKDLGVSISIDDFGSGYSSLNYLKRLPLDYLKLDRSFVNSIDQSEKDEAITGAVSTLAQSMEIHLVAEGVEALQQFQILQKQGYHELQGFLFSPPVPADKITELFQNGTIEQLSNLTCAVSSITTSELDNSDALMNLQQQWPRSA